MIPIDTPLQHSEDGGMVVSPLVPALGECLVNILNIYRASYSNILFILDNIHFIWYYRVRRDREYHLHKGRKPYYIGSAAFQTIPYPDTFGAGRWLAPKGIVSIQKPTKQLILKEIIMANNNDDDFFDFKRKARKSLTRSELDYRDHEANSEASGIIRRSGGSKADPEYLKEVAAAIYREALARGGE